MSDHVGDEGEQLVSANLHRLAVADSEVDASHEGEAREDDRHKREGRAAEGACHPLAVGGVEDAAVAVAVIGHKAVNESGDGAELCCCVGVDWLRPRVLRVLTHTRLFGQ